MAEIMKKDLIVDARIAKVLSLRTNSAAMLESLNAIGDFYVNNTVESRRSLRQDLESQNITLAKKFLAEFDEVKYRIEDVEDLSQKLQNSCDSIATRVSEADENMKLFMEKASELESRRNFYLQQSEEISTFLGKFQLSSGEIDSLYRAPIDSSSGAEAFFNALDRLTAAYGECKTMVGKHHYSAGFELLDVCAYVD